MKTLGTFGSDSPVVAPHAIGGESAEEFVQESRDRLSPSPEGQPLTTPQALLSGGVQTGGNYGGQLGTNMSFESWDAGATGDPSGWSGGGGGQTVAKETTIIQHGKASCKITNGLNAEGSEKRTQVNISATQNPEFRSQFFTFSGWVRSSTAARVSLSLNDGVTTVNSPFHSGSGTYEYLTVTMQIASTATALITGCIIASGTAIVAYFDGLMLNWGNTALAFSYHYRDHQLAIINYQDTVPANHQDYLGYTAEVGAATTGGAGLTITFSGTFDNANGMVGIATLAQDANKTVNVTSLATTSMVITTRDGTGIVASSVLWMALGIMSNAAVL